MQVNQMCKDLIYGTVSLSLSRLEGWRFKNGEIGGKYLDDCIVKED